MKQIQKTVAEIRFAREIKACFMMDINENQIFEDGRITLDKDIAKIQVNACEILTLIFDYM